MVKDVDEGRLALRDVGSGLSSSEAIYLRRCVLERVTGGSLGAVGAVAIGGRYHAENVIGAVGIPLGVVGPLPIEGANGRREVYVPLATTEGSLIASVGRGVKAIREAGAVVARVWYDGMTRAPLFRANSVSEALEFVAWLESRMDAAREAVEATTKFGKFTRIIPFVTGNNIWLRLEMTTGDAMGMNMVTIAADALVRWISHEFPTVKCLTVSGNLCSDKKEASINNLFGRGKGVSADILLPKKVVSRTLKTSAAAVCDLNCRKNLLGSGVAGSSKLNAHFANMVAALFVATGQDVAEIVESSSGYTWTEDRDGDLYFSVTMPSLEVGTIGGGTELHAQRQALELLGVFAGGGAPGDGARMLAEAVAAVTLAGELNLLCALSVGNFSLAHLRLGRDGLG